MVKIWILPWVFFQLQGHRRDFRVEAVVVWCGGMDEFAVDMTNKQCMCDGVFVWGSEFLFWFLSQFDMFQCNSRVVYKPSSGGEKNQHCGWMDYVKC